MKSIGLCANFILLSVTAASVCRGADTPALPPTASAPPAAKQAPSGGEAGMQFDNPIYDFGKVTVGEKVRHIYYFTNTGSEVLQITNVHPGCHCTTAGDWSHTTEPGKTGQIPVQFDSTGFSGNIIRTIDVYSNAKNEQHKILQLKGTIWKPIDYASTVYVNIPADSSNVVSTSMRIVNKTDSPISFSNVLSVNHLFDATLKELKPGKEYDLDITAHPPFPDGNTAGAITIKTSLSNMPTLNITAMARVTPPIQITPSQVVLVPRDGQGTTNRVTITSTITNEFVLSNPKANDSQIQVSLQPGARKGVYTVIVTTPATYRLSPGQRADITIESNQPRHPLIHIPVMQVPSPKPYASVHPNSPPATAHP